MPNYITENDAIEGKKIYCTFEKRPSIGIEKTTKRQQIVITGNPASANIMQVYH
jgi:hypothetical protein